MPKRERERAAAMGRALSSDHALTEEVREVLASAERIFPKLNARRAALAAELARIDAALATLDSLSSPNGRAHTPVRQRTRSSTRPRRSREAAPALEHAVLAALGRFSKPVGVADVLSTLRQSSVDPSRDALQVALRRLRQQGQVRATGKTRRFSYELASRPRVDAAAPPRTSRARRSRAPGSRTLSALVVETLTDKGPLGLAELSRAITSEHRVSVTGLPRLLWLLRKRGLLDVQGTRGSFRYAAIRAT